MHTDAIYKHEREARARASALVAKHSPDLSQLKKVIIDDRTAIYIPKDRDSDEARKSFLAKINSARVNSGGSNRVAKQNAAQLPDAWLGSNTD